MNDPFAVQSQPDQMKWNIKVHNKGPAVAANVLVKLREITPRPRYHQWSAEYPYPVIRANLTLDAPPARINHGDDEDYHLVMGTKSVGEGLVVDIDTRSFSRNPIHIEGDECWTLKYEVTAENAKTVPFLMQLFVESGQVKMMRLT